MWCVFAAYGGERYLHQVAVPVQCGVVAAYGGERYLLPVAVPCTSKVLVLCYGSYI
jgi:hypothetical protein